MWSSFGWKRGERAVGFQIKFLEHFGYDQGICILRLQVVRFLVEIGVN